VVPPSKVGGVRWFIYAGLMVVVGLVGAVMAFAPTKEGDDGLRQRVIGVAAAAFGFGMAGICFRTGRAAFRDEPTLRVGSPPRRADREQSRRRTEGEDLEVKKLPKFPGSSD